MGANYSHTARPNGLLLTGEIYNQDHQNHIDNGEPSKFDDYSASVGQMQTVADPGEAGSEILATSLAGELERLRFILKEMKQTAQWYTSVKGMLGYSRVQGLVGDPNSVAPTTRYDLKADAVVLRDATGGTVVRTSTGVLTNDISLTQTASQANGRDVQSAFASNAWVYLYFILGDGQPLATLASAAPPPTGPVLPAGYTHWAYATTVRTDGQAFRNTITRGNRAALREQIIVVNASTASTENTVSTAGHVPPHALSVMLQAHLRVDANASTSGQANLHIRHTSGFTYAQCTVYHIPTNDGPESGNIILELPNKGQNFFFLTGRDFSAANPPQATIRIIGYTVPNGDS